MSDWRLCDYLFNNLIIDLKYGTTAKLKIITIKSLNRQSLIHSILPIFAPSKNTTKI